MPSTADEASPTRDAAAAKDSFASMRLILLSPDDVDEADEGIIPSVSAATERREARARADVHGSLVRCAVAGIG